MHTDSVTDDRGREWVCRHDGDWAGDWRITIPFEFKAVYEQMDPTAVVLDIPSEVMAELVGRAARHTTIAALEQMSGIDFLTRKPLA